MMKIKTKSSQIWVETAIYTLIGLTLIAIILSIAIPQIQKIIEKNVVEQTLETLFQIDKELSKVGEVAGNIRIIYFKVSKGKLEINSKDDKIVYTLENTNLKFSEPGEIIKDGYVELKTVEYGKKYNIFLELENKNFNITYGGEEETKTLHKSSTSYKIKIENIGDNQPGEKIHLDFEVI